jgi:hypothetical protein
MYEHSSACHEDNEVSVVLIVMLCAWDGAVYCWHLHRLRKDAPTDRWNLALAHIARSQQTKGSWRWPQQLRDTHSSHLQSRSADDISAKYHGNLTKFTEMPLLVDVHGMSDAHGVDVALGLHPLEVAAWAPWSSATKIGAAGQTRTGMATALRACLREELVSKFGDVSLPTANVPVGRGGRGEAVAGARSNAPVAATSSPDDTAALQTSLVSRRISRPSLLCPLCKFLELSHGQPVPGDR